MIFKNKTSLMLAIWLIIIIAYRLIICLSFKFELCNGEVNNVWKILNVSNGGIFYNNPEKIPLDIFQYTPLSQVPIIISNLFFSKNNIDYVYFTTVSGRLYELVINILTTIIISKILIKNFHFNKTSSYFISLLILSNLPQTNYSIRPDSTLLFFIVLTVKYYLSCNQEYRIKNIIITSLLFSLCFLSKQDGIIISIPIAIHLLINKRIKDLLILIFFSIVSLSLALIICHLLYGEYFLFSIFNGINNPSSFEQSFLVFKRSFSFYFHVFTIAIPVCIYRVLKNDDPNKRFTLILALFYFAFGFFTSMKNGSWINYYTLSVVFFILALFVNLESNKKTKNIVFLFVGTILFNLNIIYNYTYPYLKINNYKKEYYQISKSMNEIKKKFTIKKNEKILNIGLIEKNVFFKNSIMINTEYYSNSKFNYSFFYKNEKSKIKYIIYNESKDYIYLKQIVDFFKIDFSVYEKHYFKNYVILVRK